MNEKTKQWMAELVATPEYHAAGIAQDLIFECEKRRDELGLSYAEIARRMGVSRQRIATLMSGTQNSTIGSLVRLAMVLDCQIEINLVPSPSKLAKKKATRRTHKATQQTKPKRKQPKPTPTEIHV